MPAPDRSDITEAAGERIVAFARPGKPRAIAFLRQPKCTP